MILAKATNKTQARAIEYLLRKEVLKYRLCGVADICPQITDLNLAWNILPALYHKFYEGCISL